jgi:uncharacterized protein (DUF4415 family)
MSNSTSSGRFSPKQIAAAIAAAPDGESDLPEAFWKEGFVSHSFDELKTQLAIRRRGKGKRPAKVSVSVRYDSDVLQAFQSTGKGWQTLMNRAMKDWLKTHSPAEIA